MAERGGLLVDSINALQVHTKQWVSYTPVVTATSGTITSYSSKGSYLYLAPKLIFVQLQVTMTNNGTGSGSLKASLPINFDPNNTFSVLQGIESTNGLPTIGYLTTADVMNVVIYVFSNVTSVSITGTTDTPFTNGAMTTVVDTGSGIGGTPTNTGGDGKYHAAGTCSGSGAGSITFQTYGGTTGNVLNLTGFYATK